MSRSFTFIDPLSKLTIPQTAFIKVDLPAPLGPNKAKISPLFISKFTSSSAFNEFLYVLVTFLILSIVFIVLFQL